jgi:hypothetical protein
MDMGSPKMVKKKKKEEPKPQPGHQPASGS